jgi:tetratricopeptide (TPR) repeat protein
LFFLGTLFPVAGFLNLYVFRYSLVADHFQYLPSLGIITLFSATAALLWRRAAVRRRLVGQAGCVAIVAVLAVLSWRQSRMYTDIETLYRTTIDRNPVCWMAHHNLGTVLAERGRFEGAIVELQTSLKIKPGDAETRNNLGNVLAACGQFCDAIANYRKALEIKPEYPEAQNNLGNALASHGRTDDAIAHYRKALEIKPEYAEAHYNLGNALEGRGQVNEAIAHYRKALEIRPDYVKAHYNLAGALVGRGRRDEALEHYQRALELALARNDVARADAIRARIKFVQSIPRAGSAP